MEYQSFLKSKEQNMLSVGFTNQKPLPEMLFDFQKAIVNWALNRGRAAIFADTGMGKSIMQISWADAVQKHTEGRVLIVAPLCVAAQTVREADKIGVSVKYAREFTNESYIYVTNYEMIDNFKEKIEEGFLMGLFWMNLQF
jgi:superfamily II DNA or RNA helicase